MITKRIWVLKQVTGFIKNHYFDNDWIIVDSQNTLLDWDHCQRSLLVRFHQLYTNEELIPCKQTQLDKKYL